MEDALQPCPSTVLDAEHARREAEVEPDLLSATYGHVSSLGG